MDSGWAKCAIGAAAGAALGVAIALPLAIAATGSNLETKGASQAADRDSEAADPSSGAGVPASPRAGGPAFQDRYVHRAYRCDPLMGGPGDATRPRAPGTETRVLHCLRHAQGTHNVAVRRRPPPSSTACDSPSLTPLRSARLPAAHGSIMVITVRHTARAPNKRTEIENGAAFLPRSDSLVVPPRLHRWRRTAARRTRCGSSATHG